MAEYMELNERSTFAEELAEHKAQELIRFTNTPTKVTLDSKGQHTLEWDVPLAVGDVSIPPDRLNIYTYPGKYRGAQLDLIKRVMIELLARAPRLFEMPDPVGAFVIHALLVCNTEDSLHLATDLIAASPKLMLQLHVGQPFMDEGALHVLSVNRKEDLAIELIDLALASFDKEQVRTFLNTQAVGIFFEAPPMCWYGDSPISYAAVFGLRRLVRRMLDTGLVSLNENCGKLLGLYPIHALAANGNRGMYDFLTSELPAPLRAHKTPKTRAGRLIQFNVDDMTPLQLTAKRGMRYMYQHIMKVELTRVLWVWGPVSQYQIDLTGIDSSGHGASDVMEVMIREDATHATKEFILDDFMKGFHFELYQHKWRKFGWYMHLLLRGFDFAVVVTTVAASILLKQELNGERDLHEVFAVLVTFIILFLALETAVAYLYAMNIKLTTTSHTVSTKEILRRTWHFMSGFDADTNLIGCGLILAGCAIYYDLHRTLGLGEIGAQEASSGLSSTLRMLSEDDEIAHTAETEQERAKAVYNYYVATAEAAAWHGMEPLIWLSMSLGFMLKFYAFVDQLVQPFISLSIFVLSIREVLHGPLFTFMSIFLVFISCFVFGMIVMYPDHPSAGHLPQAPDLNQWFSASYVILMAGMLGEPLDFNLNPDYIAPLGAWQKLNLVVFGVVYTVYIFMALILLLNLLIALLGSTFSQTQEDATLQGRIAFAHIMLRLELAAAPFGIDTSAGEPDGEGKQVHLFRDVQKDPDSELASDYTSENVFDRLPGEHDPHVLSRPVLLSDLQNQMEAQRAQVAEMVDLMGVGLREVLSQEVKGEIKEVLRKEVKEVLRQDAKEEISQQSSVYLPISKPAKPGQKDFPQQAASQR